MDSVWALIPAAGRGARLGGQSKQFRMLGEASVVVQTARAFAHHPEICGLVIAGPPDGMSQLGEQVDRAGFPCDTTLIPGGATRQETVQRLLAARTFSTDAGVLVHDAVRPFLSGNVLSRIVAALREHGAVAPAVDVRDTLRKRKQDGSFGETVPREGVVRMQTPQAFRWVQLKKAHDVGQGVPATDDVGLIQRNGTEVKIVEGETINFKITTPDDWAMAKALWPWWVDAERADW